MKATAVYQGGGSAGLINQDGTVNATALVNEHNRRNGSQNSALQGNGQTVIIKNNKTNPDRSEKDGSTDTDILEGRKVSASGRGKNRIRTHGANTEIIRGELEGLPKGEGNNDISLAAGETAWLSSPDFGPAQKVGGGLGESFLRNIRRVKSNGFDSIGRILSPELQEKISDTVFMEEDGTVNATALVNEHNRRNGRQKSVDNSVNGDYNYNTDDNTFEEGVNSGKQGGIHNSSRWIGQGNQNTQSRTGAVQETDGRLEANGQEGRSIRRSTTVSGNQGSQRGLTKRQSEGLKTSKVKNADGTLKVVYHFTDNMEFTTFAKGDIGFHFGSTEQAQNRGKNLKKNGRIIEAYLDIKNPVRVSVDIMSWNPAPLAMRLYGDGILSKIDYLTVLELEKQMLLPIL